MLRYLLDDLDGVRRRELARGDSLEDRPERRLGRGFGGGGQAAAGGEAGGDRGWSERGGWRAEAEVVVLAEGAEHLATR